MSRVFVTGTGRCGSVTFFKVCQHITNYTAAHETDWQRGPPDGIDYPDWHIEVSPHLVYWIPLLRAKYPKAMWAYLVRNEADTVASLASRCHKSMAGFGWQWYGIADAKLGAESFYRATTALCHAMLPDAVVVRLEQADKDFPRFWEHIQAEGNLNAAIAEFNIRHNSRNS